MVDPTQPEFSPETIVDHSLVLRVVGTNCMKRGHCPNERKMKKEEPLPGPDARMDD